MGHEFVEGSSGGEPPRDEQAVALRFERGGEASGSSPEEDEAAAGEGDEQQQAPEGQV